MLAYHQVSIHAPREGCDSALKTNDYDTRSFNSRTPGGVRLDTNSHSMGIIACFNSRTPGGVRQYLFEMTIHQGTFQFTHPGRGATRADGLIPDEVKFQFTHPGRGATRAQPLNTAAFVSFNSRTPGGVRPKATFLRGLSLTFQFTHPGRGATKYLGREVTANCGFNSRTPGGVRPLLTYHLYYKVSVSIHAPREGCDYIAWGVDNSSLFVSIHAPREGCDVTMYSIILSTIRFQFTHPGRGATFCTWDEIN